MSYESTINELFNRVIRYIKAQPLNLGGYTTISGGAGGPPGGFTGYLPQTRTAFDESEAEIWPIPSGPTLVDNLNRIRYRLANLEASGVGGSGTSWDLVVEDDSIVVLSGVTILDFTGSLTVTAVGGNKVTVSGTASSSVTNLDDLLDVVVPTPTDGDVLTWDSGTSKWVNQQPTATSGTTTISGLNEILTDDSVIVSSVWIEDDLTSQVPTSTYTVTSGFVGGSIKIYYNGIRQRKSNFTETPPFNFTVLFTTYSGDSMFVEYRASGVSECPILFDDNGDVIYEY